MRRLLKAGLIYLGLIYILTAGLFLIAAAPAALAQNDPPTVSDPADAQESSEAVLYRLRQDLRKGSLTAKELRKHAVAILDGVTAADLTARQRLQNIDLFVALELTGPYARSCPKGTVAKRQAALAMVAGLTTLSDVALAVPAYHGGEREQAEHGALRAEGLALFVELGERRENRRAAAQRRKVVERVIDQEGERGVPSLFFAAITRTNVRARATQVSLLDSLLRVHRSAEYSPRTKQKTLLILGLAVWYPQEGAEPMSLVLDLLGSGDGRDGPPSTEGASAGILALAAVAKAAGPRRVTAQELLRHLVDEGEAGALFRFLAHLDSSGDRATADTLLQHVSEALGDNYRQASDLRVILANVESLVALLPALDAEILQQADIEVDTAALEGVRQRFVSDLTAVVQDDLLPIEKVREVRQAIARSGVHAAGTPGIHDMYSPKYVQHVARVLINAMPAVRQRPFASITRPKIGIPRLVLAPQVRVLLNGR